MATTKDSATAPPSTPKPPRRVHVVTKAERARRVAAAKSFLATFGRDDVDTHASCFERLR